MGQIIGDLSFYLHANLNFPVIFYLQKETVFMFSMHIPGTKAFSDDITVGHCDFSPLTHITQLQNCSTHTVISIYHHLFITRKHRFVIYYHIRFLLGFSFCFLIFRWYSWKTSVLKVKIKPHRHRIPHWRNFCLQQSVATVFV